MAKYFPSDAKSSGQDLFTLLKKRRSIREFLTDPVPREKIDAILAAGDHAPSGGNRHAWHNVVVSDPDQKKVIREKCEAGDAVWHKNADEKLQKWLNAKHIEPVKPFLIDAPYLIVVFGDTRDPYWLESTWISVGYMMLATIDQDLGTVIYTPGDQSFLNEFLKVEDHFSPQMILPIGVPRIEPQANPKRQTQLEHEYRESLKTQTKVAEPTCPVVNTNGNGRKGFSENSKCSCGCGKNMVSLNPNRKYLHGHQKFGENGLHNVLRTPPHCKCGCGEPTDWDWERMTWKKYIDSHIGINKSKKKGKYKPRKQFDLFN